MAFCISVMVKSEINNHWCLFLHRANASSVFQQILTSSKNLPNAPFALYPCPHIQGWVGIFSALTVPWALSILDCNVCTFILHWALSSVCLKAITYMGFSAPASLLNTNIEDECFIPTWNAVPASPPIQSPQLENESTQVLPTARNPLWPLLLYWPAFLWNPVARRAHC